MDYFSLGQSFSRKRKRKLVVSFTLNGSQNNGIWGVTIGFTRTVHSLKGDCWKKTLILQTCNQFLLLDIVKTWNDTISKRFYSFYSIQWRWDLSFQYILSFDKVIPRGMTGFVSTFPMRYFSLLLFFPPEVGVAGCHLWRHNVLRQLQWAELSHTRLCSALIWKLI